MIRGFWVIVLYISQIAWATAADNPTRNYAIQQLDNRLGLSNSAVNCVLQDTDDMLWIGTWDGLNRYDGKDFHVFNYKDYSLGDSNSIGSNVIRHLLEDHQGNIWISTIEGISRYDKGEGKFHHYFYLHQKQHRISEQEFQVAIDTAGRIYARTAIQGLMEYDAMRDTFLSSTLPTIQEPLADITFDATNRLWTRTVRGGLQVYNRTQDGQFQPDLSISLPNSPITGIYQTNGQFFFSDEHGRLYQVVMTSGIPKLVAHVSSAISALVWYEDHYYLALAGNGIGVYNAQFIPQPLTSPALHQLASMKITGWAVGKGRLLWASTDGNGIIRVAPKKQQFVTLSPRGTSPNRPVRAIGKVGNDLWVGTKGGGIASLHPFGYQKEGQWNDITANGELSNNSVFAIHSSTTDLVFIGTDGKGLSVYDMQRARFFNWHELVGHNNFPDFGSVYAILEDIDGTLWLGTSGYGIVHMRAIRNKQGQLEVAFLNQFRYHADGSGLANDIVYALCFGEGNQLWIACRYGGLSLLDRQSGHITTFKAFTYEGSLSNNDVLSLYKDHQHRLWIGTSYGLNWISLYDSTVEQPVFGRINDSHGLPNNTIHAITEDELGNIWVSTNRGLARIHSLNSNIVHFQESDGLQSSEFSDGAVWKDTNGYLYFGGIYGLNYFLPEPLYGDIQQPNLVVRSIRAGDDRMHDNGYLVFRPNEVSGREYVLSRSDNFFSADIHALSFLHADKCEYAWILEDHDKDWHYGATNGRINYGNLPPGNYTLRIKWSNGEGVWTAGQDIFLITVKPYWWQTWPALASAALLVIAGIYLLYINRKNKLNIQHRLQLEQTLREKDEAMHEEQLNFFTNIAHELQTPLTLIMGVTERLTFTQDAAQDKRAALLTILNQQTSQLTYLVQQLLEFRKAEAGYLQPHYEQADVSALLDKLTELFIPLSEQQQITYERHIPDGISLPVDRDKLEKIVFNLLSNAFKHAGKREHVIISASVVGNSTGLMRLVFSNSGCLLNPQELDRIFARFQTGRKHNADSFSTGIGLAFTKELVGVLGGTISVSLESTWITFQLDIPIPYGEHASTTSADGQQEWPTAPLIYANMAKVASAQALTTVDYNKAALLEMLTEANKKTILIVEDEPDIRYLLREMLKDRYVVYEAADGLEAISIIKNHIPELIISDVMMPGMDGLTLCNKVKNTPATCHIPFIILSAKGSMEQRTEGYEVGADAYIAKPFHSSHLHVRIKNLFEQQQRLHQVFKDATIGNGISSTGNGEHDEFLAALVDAIKSRLDDPSLNASTLENALSLSKMQLYRKLKTASGMTPAEFIRHIRLKHAAHLLTSTPLTVTEIFYQVGFNNQSYFFREFKKQYQCPPADYRNQHKMQI